MGTWFPAGVSVYSSLSYSYAAMKCILPYRTTSLLAFGLPLILAVTLSGCTLLGMGAAAGAGVGGCSLLDDNNDDKVTETEFSRGLFDDWETDDDGTLTEEEFEAGIDQGGIFSDWSGDFDAWDTDGDDALTEAEFEAGVAEDNNTAGWLDSQCDSLGL